MKFELQKGVGMLFQKAKIMVQSWSQHLLLNADPLFEF